MIPTLIVDHNEHWGWDDKLRDVEFAKTIPGHTLFSHLYQLGEARGMRVVSADRYLAQTPRNAGCAVMVSHGYSKWRSRLRTRKCIPALVINTEPPLIDVHFYSDVSQAVDGYHEAWLWKGCHQWLPHSVQVFKELRYPADCDTPVATSTRWEHRRPIVMISGAKVERRVRKVFRESVGLVATRQRKERRKGVRQIKMCLRYMISNPGLPNLYKERLNCLAVLSEVIDSDLYGRGWESMDEIPTKWRNVAKRCYRDELPVGLKLSKLAEYKFAICFENTSFPGYVSEKIFDCLLAGTIPLYLGAPDIGDIIPVNCYVDCRRFRDYRGLREFVLSLLKNHDEIDVLRSAGRSYLASDHFRRCRADVLAESILDVAEPFINTPCHQNV